MSSRPKPITHEDAPRREPKQSGVNIKTPDEEREPEDPFAEFHDGWEPVRRRKSGAPGQ